MCSMCMLPMMGSSDEGGGSDEGGVVMRVE